LTYAVLVPALITFLLLPSAAAERPYSVTGSVQHFSGDRIDATSYSLLFSEGIKRDLGATLELTRIDDDAFRITLIAARVNKLLTDQEKSQVWVFGGARYIRGEHDFLRGYDAVAPLAGVSATVALAPALRLDASAGLSFFDKTLAEYQAAVSREITPDVLISAGYKTYRAGGDSLGGPTLSVTWRR
jgi:hypothetical protein